MQPSALLGVDVNNSLVTEAGMKLEFISRNVSWDHIELWGDQIGRIFLVYGSRLNFHQVDIRLSADVENTKK